MRNLDKLRPYMGPFVSRRDAEAALLADTLRGHAGTHRRFLPPARSCPAAITAPPPDPAKEDFRATCKGSPASNPSEVASRFAIADRSPGSVAIRRQKSIDGRLVLLLSVLASATVVVLAVLLPAGRPQKARHSSAFPFRRQGRPTGPSSHRIGRSTEGNA